MNQSMRVILQLAGVPPTAADMPPTDESRPLPMATFDRHNGFDGSSSFVDGEACRQSSGTPPIAVHSCSRLGLQANPPARSFGGWFRLR